MPQVVATIFADPWPEDLLSSFLFTLSRRLFNAPGAAEYLLACAGAVARAGPSRVKHEQLHQMWDTCLRWAPPCARAVAARPCPVSPRACPLQLLPLQLLPGPIGSPTSY